MAEYPKLGISESELVEELDEAVKDLFMTSDKIKAYGPCGSIEESAHFFRLYVEHISATEKVESMIDTGKKYFPYGEWSRNTGAHSSLEMRNGFEDAINGVLSSNECIPFLLNKRAD
jgi:hypothetical protein